MGKMLTAEEWRVQKPPFAWTEIDYPTWTDLHFDIAEKWAVEHAEGWVYRKAKMFVFGLQSDATLFDLWLEEGILERESRGKVEAKES